MRSAPVARYICGFRGSDLGALRALSCAFARLLHAAPAGRWSLERKNAVLLATQAMIIDEKLLEFPLEFIAKIIKSFHVRIAVVFIFDRDHAVVALRLLFIALLTLNHADN